MPDVTESRMTHFKDVLERIARRPCLLVASGVSHLACLQELKALKKPVNLCAHCEAKWTLERDAQICQEMGVPV